MRIGIITWFTGPNYGTNLQAIALQYYLRKQGYEVELINCEVESEYSKNRRTFIEKIEFFPEKCAQKLACRVFFKKEKAIRDEKLVKTIRKNCILTRRCEAEKDLVEVFNSFDLLISGSDQIWNPNWYHRFYYADYEGVTTRRISYAPSMGVTKILDEVEPEIKRSVSKFDAISVREENAASLLEPYSKYKPVVAVDPTLLLDSNDWASILPPTGAAPKSDYVLGFFIEGNFDHLHATKKFAKQKKMKYVFVPYSGLSYYQIGDRRADAGLEDLLELIRNARYVITDSFHITVFSIIHRKQFYSFMRYRENPVTSTNSRIRNLLHMAGLENRGLEFGTRKIKELPDIDYAPHMKMLQQEIEKSKEFLQKSIRGEYRGEV